MMQDPNEAARQLQQVQQVNFNRGRVRFGEMIDALTYTCIAAEAGDAGARMDLRMFSEAMERVRTALAGIASANGVKILPPR
jgi:hypothetical protein